MSPHRKDKFTTRDQDNDNHNDDNCGVSFKGGWWYDRCHEANLNGLYNDDSYGVGVNWYDWKGHRYSLKFTDMKVRPY